MHKSHLILLCLSLLLCSSFSALSQDGAQLKEDTSTLILNYDKHVEQFGQLFLPDDISEPLPVLIVIHGGCFQSFIGLETMQFFSEAFRQEGIAVWNIEYRRLGNGGGYPETFLDVANATDFLRELASKYNLDLDRVVAVGHSAGGPLALWLGARDKLGVDSELYQTNPLALKAVISLAGITDLARASHEDVCDQEAERLVQGDVFPERYLETSPEQLLPFGTPQIIMQGRQDRIVPPEHVTPYVEKARVLDTDIRFIAMNDAEHFELVAPTHIAFQRVKKAILESF